MELVDLSHESAIEHRDFNGMVATFYENERPLQGLVGHIDWRFRGVISDYFKKGIISGAPDEIVYIPVKKREEVFHLLLVGCGSNESPGERKSLGKDSLQKIEKQIKGLHLENMVVSKSDVGAKTEQSLESVFKGVSVCLVH